MLQDKSGPAWALALVAIFFLGVSLFLNLPVIHNSSSEGVVGFLPGDQSTYYAMAQSLAFDGDLEYKLLDLVRYNQDFAAGPLGLFLKQVKRPDGEHLYYAKNLAYPLFAAPFVRVFGPNGPLVLHAVLLFLVLLMGWSYFSLAAPPGPSLLRVLTFLFASVAWLYYLWISPEIFNLSLVFASLFLWLYKHRSREAGDPPPGPGMGWWRRFLLSNASDYLAAFVGGIAVYAKPPNVAVLGPILLWHLLRKKILKTAGLTLAAGVSIVLLFGLTVLLTSDWNYQGGERKSFYFTYPYERPGVTFDNAPASQSMTSDGYAGWALISAKYVPINLFYYFFGRYTGVAWYFFPAFLFLILFFIGKKSLDRWLLLAALAGEILIYVVLMPTNYGGGGGSLANRYFLGIYPFFLFLAGPRIRRSEITLSWGVAALLLGQMFISPIQTAMHPSTQGKRFPFTLFPIEKTLINDLQTNTNPYAFRLEWIDPRPNNQFLYFLNDNFHKKERTEAGWWTLGDRELDMMLRTFFPVKEVRFHLTGNLRQSNAVTMEVDGRRQTAVLGPGEQATLTFPVGEGFTIRESHQYRIKIGAAKGAFPYFEDRKSTDRRWLGVFFTPEVVGR
jgi:hypothetical protein